MQPSGGGARVAAALCPGSHGASSEPARGVLTCSASAHDPRSLQVLAQKQNLLQILSRTTGHSPEKLDKVRHGFTWRHSSCCLSLLVFVTLGSDGCRGHAAADRSAPKPIK